MRRLSRVVCQLNITVHLSRIIIRHFYLSFMICRLNKLSGTYIPVAYIISHIAVYFALMFEQLDIVSLDIRAVCVKLQVYNPPAQFEIP